MRGRSWSSGGWRWLLAAGGVRYGGGMRSLLTGVVAALVGCGGGEGRETASASGATDPVTSDGPATSMVAPTSGEASSSSGSSVGGTSSGTSTSGVGPTTSDETSSGAVTSSTTTSEDTSASSSGEPVCDPNVVADTVAFTYVKKFDTGLGDKILQASYYNTVADEVMIMSYNGQARRFTVDGAPIGEVFAVPQEALPKLDGATFDPVNIRGLLINQDCVLTEVEPQTLAVIATQPLGFGMSVCAGLALGLDGNLYIASYGTNEMVVLSRDGLAEVRRVDMATVPLTGFDGLALIAGSENFLVMSTSPATEAAIIDPLGNVVVATSALGQAAPPMIGGMPMLPDAVLTICGNGHAWVCEAYDATCFDYAPDDGDKNACECIVPG